MTDREPDNGLWNLSSLVPGQSEAAAPPPKPATPEAPASPAARATPEAVPERQPWTQPQAPPAAPEPDSWPPRPRPSAGNWRRMIAVAAAVLVVLVAGAIVVGVRLSKGPAPDPASALQAEPTVTATTPILEATTDPVPEPTTAEPTTEPATVDPEEAAVTELQRIYDQDLPTVSFTGQYAAQIASKYPGISDPMQTTESGSHTFQATDILAEHQRLRDAHNSDDHPIVLLKSTDYGKRQLVGSHFLWVTFALGDFPSKQAVLTWCDTQFSDLAQAERANQCAVRRLEP